MSPLAPFLLSRTCLLGCRRCQVCLVSQHSPYLFYSSPLEPSPLEPFPLVPFLLEPSSIGPTHLCTPGLVSSLRPQLSHNWGLQ